MSRRQDLIDALLEEFEISDNIPRYTYYFDNEITTETVQELIDILYQYEAIDLYICTPGGEGPAMNALINFINKHSDIKIYLSNYIASAGTFLLTDCNKEIIITPDLEFILFHLGDRSVEGQFRKQTVNSNILYKQLKNLNDNLVGKCRKLGLNEKELNEILKGEDLVLYPKDFRRLKLNNLK